ncbi:hypothetical protein BGX34_009329 [Mortierella sp. NVP85]|nr:hypothetical protein BGX34_009329 [Mortierella sp. NVP85]
MLNQELKCHESSHGLDLVVAWAGVQETGKDPLVASLSSSKGTDSLTMGKMGGETDMDDVEDEDGEEEDTLDGVSKSDSPPPAPEDVVRWEGSGGLACDLDLDLGFGFDRDEECDEDESCRDGDDNEPDLLSDPDDTEPEVLPDLADDDPEPEPETPDLDPDASDVDKEGKDEGSLEGYGVEEESLDWDCEDSVAAAAVVDDDGE